LVVGALIQAAPAHAQGAGVDAALYSATPKSYVILSAGSTRPLAAPLALGIYGTWYAPLNGSGGNLLGAGLDLSLWRAGMPGLYLIGGFSGGFGFSGAHVLWGSYALGAGYDFRLFSTVGLGVEARWRGLTQGGDEGVQVGARIGLGMRRKSAAASPPGGSASAPPEPSPASGPTGSPTALAVVETALGVMGSPYTWGGSSADGFDCSGLIRYSYAAHGVPLPRTSAEQARQGVAVDRDLGSLAPGDILTFAGGAGGTAVTHVGLYLGNGEFIHSATNGVRKSRLSAGDPYGRWWWDRWVGARRVLPG
jgi:cell wall-associated NlpC family hydrolase